jgi:hypothetical protein
MLLHALIKRWVVGKDMDDNEVPWPYAYSDEMDLLMLTKYKENESQLSDVNTIMKEPNIAED